MNLMPIGSVFVAQEAKAVVLGYYVDQKEDRFVTSYIVCGYPLGFTDMDSLALVPVDGEMELVFQGYRGEHFPVFIKNKNEFYELSRQYTVTEWNEQLERMEQALRDEMKKKGI